MDADAVGSRRPPHTVQRLAANGQAPTQPPKEPQDERLLVRLKRPVSDLVTIRGRARLGEGAVA